MKNFTEDRIQFPKRAHFRKDSIAETLQKESRAETLYREDRKNEKLHRRQNTVPKRAHFRKNRIAETLQKGMGAETLQRGQRRLYTSQKTEYKAKKSTLQKEQNR
jgi:hypothetical protein